MKGSNLGEFEELVLLAVRRLGDQATGSGIQALLEREAGRRATLGAIYAALDRGGRKGLVESWLGEPLPAPGGRARRHYAVTPAGVAALRESRRARESLWRPPGQAAGISDSSRTQKGECPDRLNGLESVHSSKLDPVISPNLV